MAQQQYGAVNRLFGKYKDQVTCTHRSQATLLRLLGGMYNIGDDINEQFLRAYANDAMSIQYCFSEIVTTVAPFFIDIDYFDHRISLEQANSDEFKKQMAAWCSAAVRAIGRVTVDTDEVQIDEIEGGATVDNIKQLRDTMSPKSAVLTTAPARTVTKDDVTGTKVGIHMIWPNLLVTKATAQRLQGIVTAALYDMSPEPKWDKIIDLAVYRPVSSLRMLYSYKFKKCATCKPEDCKTLAILREQAIKATKLKKKATRNELREVYDQLVKTEQKVPDPLKEFLYPTKKACSACDGRGKVLDIGAGYYKISAVLNGDATLNLQLSDLAEADIFLAVWLNSVRRPAGTVETELTIPENAPLALQVKVTASESDYVRDGVEVSHKPYLPEDKYTPCDLLCKESDVLGIAQDWLRSQRSDWDQLQISSLFRLKLKTKLAESKMLNGESDYLVVITVRGFGANYCSMAGRCHSSNHIYFVLNSNKLAVQKCHSEATAECRKPGKAFKIDRKVFAMLYPFEKSTFDVSSVAAEDIPLDKVIEKDEEAIPSRASELIAEKDQVKLGGLNGAARFVTNGRRRKLHVAGGTDELDAFHKRRKLGKYKHSADVKQEAGDDEDMVNLDDFDVEFD